MPDKKPSVHAVILAGGRGTRFWPRSRTRTPKQLLNIVGKTTMLQQTVERLLPLIPSDRIWAVTNAEQSRLVLRQMPSSKSRRVLSEPVGRNTAAAIGFAAIQIRHALNGADALLAVLPADHYIGQPEVYREIVATALEAAREPGRMVVLGIPPTRPDTGFGYIERGAEPLKIGGISAFPVRRFTEKPPMALAKEYLAGGNYFWNAGMFFWRISTFMEALKEFLPKTHQALESLSRTIGKFNYRTQLKKLYADLENISVDYAVLEKAASDPSRVLVFPADIDWSDLGSWAAVYELLAKQPAENIFSGLGQVLDAQGNFVWSPGKFIAALGVHDLVVVEAPDALLICPRDRAQEVGKIVQALEERQLKYLL